MPAATPKAVYACPLREDFRELLRTGRPAAGEAATGPQEAGREERFTELWRDVIAEVVRVATEYDREWIRWRRKVNILLVVLFVFRRVFAPDRQGYAATLHQVWEQCRQLELELPLPSAEDRGGVLDAATPCANGPRPGVPRTSTARY